MRSVSWQLQGLCGEQNGATGQRERGHGIPPATGSLALGEQWACCAGQWNDLTPPPQSFLLQDMAQSPLCVSVSARGTVWGAAPPKGAVLPRDTRSSEQPPPPAGKRPPERGSALEGGRV